MVLLELTTYLAAQSIGLTAATNLFYGFMPPSPDALVTLYEYGGLPNEPVMGGTTVRMEFPLIQAAARGARDDYDGPRLQLQKVVTAFTKIGDQDLSGVRYGAVMAKNPVTFLNRDADFRVTFVVNFQVTKDYSST